MGWNIKNNWADIAQLETSDSVTDSKFETETEFRLQLYTGTYELDLECGRYTVGFKKMTLQLECEGTEIALGERFGDCIPEDQAKKISIESTATTQGNAAIKAKLDASTILNGNILSGEANASVAGNTTHKESEARTETKRHVVAKPNNKWEINSLTGNALSAKHITTDTILCRILPVRKTNRTNVQAHLYAHKNDLIVVEAEDTKSRLSWLASENKNKEKVFKVLLAKLMRGAKEDLNASTQVQLSLISSHNDDE